MRLIDKDELLRRYDEEHEGEPGRARKLIEEAPTVGGWNSVKDRMPPDGRFVLVVNDDGKMMIAKFESEVLHWEYKYYAYDWDVWEDEEQGPICYWMPLPEPPEEGEAGD